MRIFLTGSSGMLGNDLTAVLSQCHDLTMLDETVLDITDEKAVRAAVTAAKPEVVVHAAAYTDVERAEDEPDTAFLVNETGTKHVALAAKRVGARVVYFSTDFVFDGTKGAPYAESDKPHALSVYGRSKLAGEQQAKGAGLYCVVRTAWLYGPQKANFVEKIIAAAGERGQLKVTAAEVGSPTYTLDLALATAWIVEKGLTGLYHVTDAGWCTRYEFACEIVKQAGLENVMVEPAGSNEIRMKAARPTFGVLSTDLWESRGGPPLRHWKDALRAYMSRHDRWTVLQLQKTKNQT